MQEDTIAQLIDLLSLSRLLQVAVVLACAWLALRIVHLGLQQLIQRFPRYRLQMGQIFPVIRIFTWFLAIAFIV